MPRSRKMSVLRCRFCDRDRSQPSSSNGERKTSSERHQWTSDHMWPKNVQINIWFSRNATGRKQVLAQQRKWRRKTLLASLTWSWNPNVPNLTDPRRCLDLATRKLALLAVGSCFKNVQPPRTSFLESPAEKIAAIVTRTDQKMPKDRTILSSSSQKARARTCKEKDEERSAHAPKEPENGCHGVAMVRQRRCTGRTSSCRRTTQIQVKSISTAGRRFWAEGRRRSLNQTSTKKKAKRRRCSRVQANVEGLFKYNINLGLVFMANKDQL